jgi:hypothetical protein
MVTEIGLDLAVKKAFIVGYFRVPWFQQKLTVVSENRPIQTPSTHRQRLAAGNGPALRMDLANLQSNGVTGTPTPQEQPSPRQPLATLNNNSISGTGFAGYGMSAGLKVSNLTGTSPNAFARPVVRSRGLFLIQALLRYPLMIPQSPNDQALDFQQIAARNSVRLPRLIFSRMETTTTNPRMYRSCNKTCSTSLI